MRKLTEKEFDDLREGLINSIVLDDDIEYDFIDYDNSRSDSSYVSMVLRRSTDRKLFQWDFELHYDSCYCLMRDYSEEPYEVVEKAISVIVYERADQLK